MESYLKQTVEILNWQLLALIFGSLFTGMLFPLLIAGLLRFAFGPRRDKLAADKSPKQVVRPAQPEVKPAQPKTESVARSSTAKQNQAEQKTAQKTVITTPTPNRSRTQWAKREQQLVVEQPKPPTPSPEPAPEQETPDSLTVNQILSDHLASGKMLSEVEVAAIFAVPQTEAAEWIAKVDRHFYRTLHNAHNKLWYTDPKAVRDALEQDGK